MVSRKGDALYLTPKGEERGGERLTHYGLKEGDSSSTIWEKKKEKGRETVRHNLKIRKGKTIP